MKLISRSTWLYGIFIIISASFLQQILFFFNKSIGTKTVQNIFYTICFIAAISILSYLLKQKLKVKNYLIIICLFLCSFLLMHLQPFFAEKTHIILYGVLGYLAKHDLQKTFLKQWTSFFISLSFCLLISTGDELFQVILPYRVGELFDMFTNVFSSIMGISLFIAIHEK